MRTELLTNWAENNMPYDDTETGAGLWGKGRRGALDAIAKELNDHPRKGKQDWETPPELFAACERRFGRHHIDLAANEENKKCELYLGPGSVYPDALIEDWNILFPATLAPVARGFLNPGFKKMSPWVAACVSTRRPVTMVCLPSLDTAWARLAIRHADVYHLWPRVPFIDKERPEKMANDRNTMILDFTPGRRRAPCLWNWKTDEITEFTNRPGRAVGQS